MVDLTKPRPLTFHSIHEDIPGLGWLDLFRVTASAYRSWYLNSDSRPRPTLTEAERQLRRHMPELASTWEHLCTLTGGDCDIARMLTLWNPPRFLPGCSQAVLVDDEGPLLVRNYDYDPSLCERVVTSTRWSNRRVLGTSDCLWGLVDGMNESGLAASLTYAGPADIGHGFGIPLVLRYLLETCETVEDVKITLARLPVHMAYNITVVDANAKMRTFFVAPGQQPEEFATGIATNHRGQSPRDELHARRFRSVERYDRLTRLIAQRPPASQFVQQFLQAPLYNTDWDNAFGTVYTAAYRPTAGTLDLVWPCTRWQRTFDSPTGSHDVILGIDPNRSRHQTIVGPLALTSPTDRDDTEHMNDAGDRDTETAQHEPRVLALHARRAITALAESDDPAAFNELLTLSSDVGAALGLSARNLAHTQSWAGVGQYAGLSRQTAWARWGRTENH